MTVVGGRCEQARDEPTRVPAGDVEDGPIADPLEPGVPPPGSRARERAREREQRRLERTAKGPRRLHLKRLLPAASPLLETTWGRVLAASVGLLALGTVVGVLALWPGHREHKASQAFGGKTVAGRIVRVVDGSCGGPTPQTCRSLVIRVAEGAGAGETTKIMLGPAKLASHFEAGDRVRVQAITAPAGTPIGQRYTFAGLDRRGTLLWLLIAFAALVIVLARWRGLLALGGFALSLALVTKFLVPAMLAGSPPMLVAVVGSLAVMFVTVGLTYGLTPQSAAAALGIAGSLLFAGVVGTIAVNSARLDGKSSELANFLTSANSNLSLQGIVLAGLVLGALGVLADMGVTQASAVMALRRANPELPPRQVFNEAFTVGRDHLVATTHTLVLAYVGAALPLLLVLQSAGVAGTDALNAQDVAEPIVATLVGAMALLISVPLTTALSTILVARIPAAAIPESHAGHHHH
jgi:uncharacterized membrane protein